MIHTRLFWNEWHSWNCQMYFTDIEAKVLPAWIVLEWYRLIKQWLILPRRQKGKNEIKRFWKTKVCFILLWLYPGLQVDTIISLCPRFVPNIPFSKSEVNLTNWIEHISLKWSKYLPLDFGRSHSCWIYSLCREHLVNCYSL